VQFLPFFMSLNGLIALNWFLFTAVAAQRAATGQLFSYPLALRWIGFRRRATPPTLERSL
jgi:uncharacterized Tic20 family protein